MQKRLVASVAASVAALLASGSLAGFVPISRSSTYSGEGFFRDAWNYPYEPIIYYTWDRTDSCTTFGAWTPSNAYSHTGRFWHFSTAATNSARFIAYAEISGYGGNRTQYSDDQKTGFEYVFDVPRTTRVRINGFGQVKMTSAAGYTLLGSALVTDGKEYTLPPSRYTIKDTFTNGHGGAHFEMKNLDCLGDIDNNAIVDDDDFLDFAAAYDVVFCSEPAMPVGCPADLDANWAVDDTDFMIFVLSYTAVTCP